MDDVWVDDARTVGGSLVTHTRKAFLRVPTPLTSIRILPITWLSTPLPPGSSLLVTLTLDGPSNMSRCYIADGHAHRGVTLVMCGIEEDR
jgi:hypothetical protein